MLVVGADIEIRTERLVLRPMRMSDAEPLFELFANWEVIRWLSMPPWPYAIEDARSFLGGQLDQDFARTSFAIERDQALIGGIDIRMNPPGRSQRARGPNLGYWLGQPYWGRGYMTEAAAGFLAHIFAAGIGDTVYSGAFADNAASLRVQAKLGFVPDGETLLYARPRDAEFPHINTVLTGERFKCAK